MSAIDEARRLLAEATQGAWVQDEERVLVEFDETIYEDGEDVATCSSPERCLNDAALIAAAPRLLRALCEEVDRHRDVLGDCNAALWETKTALVEGKAEFAALKREREELEAARRMIAKMRRAVRPGVTDIGYEGLQELRGWLAEYDAAVKR